MHQLKRPQDIDLDKSPSKDSESWSDEYGESSQDSSDSEEIEQEKKADTK